MKPALFSLIAACALSAAAQEATPEFYRVPLLNGLVILKDRADFKPNGLPYVGGLVVPDVPLLKAPAFEKLVAPYLSRPMTSNSMAHLQREIILYYRAHDRPLVDVLYPEQVVDNGVLQVIVLEARLADVKLKTADGQPYTNAWTKPEFLRQQVHLRKGDPIIESGLKKDLDWLNRNPFRKVNLLYQSTPKYGESEVILRAADRMPIGGYVGYEDTGSTVTEEGRLLAGFNWGKAFGLQDHLFNYQFTASPDFESLLAHSGSYVLPLPWRHTIRLSGYYLDVKGTLGSGAELKGNSYQASMRYEIPLPFLQKYQHELSLGMDYKSAENNFAFGQSTAINTPTEILQFAVGYSGVLPDPWGQTVVGVQAYYSPGNLTDNNTDTFFNASRTAAEANYAYARVSLERLTRLPGDFSWILRGVGQVADGNLLVSEQLGVGGFSTVRGYDEREANGDVGWLFSNELRSPPFSVARWCHLGKVEDQLQFLGFWDYGVAANRIDNPIEDPHVILSSVGVGVRYTVSRYFSLRFDYGWQLTDSGQSPTGDNSRGHIGAVLSY